MILLILDFNVYSTTTTSRGATKFRDIMQLVYCNLGLDEIIIVYYAIRQPHQTHTMLYTVQNIKAHTR